MARSMALRHTSGPASRGSLTPYDRPAHSGRCVALLVLAGADVDRIVEHVDRARWRSEDGYRPRS